MPDRSLVRPWLSTYVVGRATGPSTYVFTSLGCPYRCSFCSIWPQYGGAYHQRDVESVIAELKTLDEYEVVRFADANTLVDLGFARRLFERIAAEGIRKTFIMDIRADTAAKNPDLIALLARGGLRVVITGFESPNREELQRYGKNLKADLIGEAIKVFHDNGVMLRGNYIVRPDYGEAQFADAGGVRRAAHGRLRRLHDPDADAGDAVSPGGRGGDRRSRPGEVQLLQLRAEDEAAARAVLRAGRRPLADPPRHGNI